MSQVIKDSPYRWVVVAAGGIMGCAAMGALFALPVLLKPMADDMGWSHTGMSRAMTLAFLSMAATSMIWGGLSDRFGARPVVMVGAVAAFFAPMMATVTGWFTAQRSLAVSLVSAGAALRR